MKDAIKICKQCGKEYDRKSLSSKCGFCSARCENAYNYVHYTKSKREAIKENRKIIRLALHTKVCDECGVEFYKKTSLFNKLNFCSKECQAKYRLEHGGVGMRKFVCKYCGSEFERYAHPHQYAYCSCSCSSRAKAERINVVEKAKEGKAISSDELKIVRSMVTGKREYREVLAKVLNKSKQSCYFCGVSGVRLHAHHIVPMDKNFNLINNPENLVVLCTYCHAKLHNIMRKMKKFGLIK